MRLILPLVLCCLAAPLRADPPEVVRAEASRSSTGWTVSVTLAHPDTGWDHYADGWRGETEDGTVLGLRDLVHPHETEQPFTRSLNGVDLPTRGAVYIRARCLVDGWSEERYPLTLD